MASKLSQKTVSSVQETEELLDNLDKTLDRLKTLYEQYFLGVLKQAPGPLHSEVERKIRDLLQVQLRNTLHRYRFATLQQKFSSYNAYWRRTLRQIENGTYIRQLHKLGRTAAKNGYDIPEEILASMPKRMREQVIRDRDAAIALAKRRGKLGADGEGASEEALLELGGDDFAAEPATSGDAPFANEEAPMELSEDAFADAIAMIKESTELRRQVKNARGPHKVGADDAELDINAFFASVEAEGGQPEGPKFQRSVARATAAPAPAPAPPPPPAADEAPAPDKFVPSATSPGIQPMARKQAREFPRDGKRPTSPPMTVPKPPTSVPSVIPPRTTQPGLGPTPTPPAQRISQPMMAATPTPPAQRISQPMPAQPGPPQRESRPIPIQVGRDTPLPRRAVRDTDQDPPSEVVVNTPARPVQAIPRRPTGADTPPPQRMGPPPGMTEGDVNALYAKYVKAKEMVGENAGPGARDKLLKTINAQAPKIMEQYKAKGVDFQIVVKDNQVIIRAKPKT